MSNIFEPTTPPQKPATPPRILKTRPGATPVKSFPPAAVDTPLANDKAQELFVKYDRNKDGVISKSEFIDVLKELTPNATDEELQQQVDAFLTLCEAKNDEISLEQFASQFAAKNRSRPDNDDFDVDIKFKQAVYVQKSRMTDELKDDEEVTL